MQINCIHCGHRFDLGKNYDDYEGLVKCNTCAGLLDVKTEDGCVRAVRFGQLPGAAEQPSIQIMQPQDAKRRDAA